jgi:hypothetical protein
MIDMKEFNKELTVLVASCDAYNDVACNFIKLFRKYWPDCPFEVVCVSEMKAANGDGCQFDREIMCGAGGNWCSRLVKALDDIATSYVLMLCDDYYLERTVDTDLFMKRLSQARQFDAANLRMIPNPPTGRPYRDGLLEYPKQTAYCIATQAGIWNRAFLRKLADGLASIWEFERYGSFMVGDEKRPLLVTPEKEFPFVDAVHKGCWEKFGVDVCRRNGVKIDFSVRGLPSLQVRLCEGVKKLIFAVFPWTLIVRIQNLLDVGMKEKKK